jgi:hypothetical protein
MLVLSTTARMFGIRKLALNKSKFGWRFYYSAFKMHEKVYSFCHKAILHAISTAPILQNPNP